MTSNTSSFLLNLTPSEMNEPDITNEEFLESHYKIGVWLRVLSAHESLERFNSSRSTTAQRLAALSNIYLQMGAQLEDQAVSLIAFSVWSKNRNLPLVNIFSRIFVKRQSRSISSEINEVHEKLSIDHSKSVPVDQIAFFKEVEEMNDAEIVEFFLGYKWRKVPSVRLIPKKHIQLWEQLPGELRRIANSFCNEKYGPRMTAAYNKLKHGPQLIVQNPIDRAKQFGVSPDVHVALSKFKSFDKPTVRLLFRGGKTQSNPSDGTMRSIAPFLVDDKEAVNKLFFGTMVHEALLFNQLIYMQISLYQMDRKNIENLDQGILRIIEAHGKQLKKS